MSDASTLFEMMAAVNRRRILLLLLENESIQVPDDVQTRSTGQRQIKQPSMQGRDKRRSATASQAEDEQSFELNLVHKHLPKLEAEDLIEWDQETQTISRGPAYEEVAPALTLIAKNPERIPGDLL